MCCFVNVSVCFVCCVLDSVCELLVKQFAMCLGVVVILSLNVIVFAGLLCQIPMS